MKNASIVFTILCTATLASCEGLAIVGCNSDGSMSVEDHHKDFLLVCGGLDMTSYTFWTFQDRNTSNPPQIISNCSAHSSSSSSSPPVWSCVSAFNVMIKTNINEHTRRSHVILPDMSVGRFPDGTWRCKNGGRVAECSIDVVYTPTDVQCQVTIDEDRSMVEGTCHISKMFSSHGKYSCQWFEKNGNQEEVALPSSQTQFTRSDCSKEGVVYFCGYCSFSKGLPAISERYGYRVLILPGKIYPSVEFTVKPKADVPSSPQTQLPPNSSVADVDEDAVNAALNKGIGIGLGSLLAFLLIAAVVFAVWKWRKTAKKEKDDVYDTPVDINPISQANNNSTRPRVPVIHPRPSQPRDNARPDDDGCLTTVDINSTSQTNNNGTRPRGPVPHRRPSQPRDNARPDDVDGYLIPVNNNPTSQANSNSSPQPLPVSSQPRDNAQIHEDDSQTVPKQPAGNDGNRGGNRALPALPDSCQGENDDSDHLSIDNYSLPSKYGSVYSFSQAGRAEPNVYVQSAERCQIFITTGQ